MFSVNTKMLSLTLVIVLTIINPTQILAQRSPYAGSRPNGYHDQFIVHTSTEEVIVNRFGEDNNASQRPPFAGIQIVQGSPDFAPIATSTPNPVIAVGLGNRVDLTSGGTGNSISTVGGNGAGAASNTPTSTTTTRLPYDAYNDQYAVDFYNRGSDDKKPFWLLNAQHIERQRNATTNQVANNNPTVSQNTFLDNFRG